MGATSDETQSSVADVALRASVVDITLDSTLPRLTDLPAGTLILSVAALRAESYFVALAGPVARNHGLNATDQSVAIVVGWTTALCNVIHHATSRAFAASFATFARISALVVHAGLFVGTRVITAATDIAQPVEADLIGHAVIVTVADGLADSSIAAFVAQTISIASASGVAGSSVASLSSWAVQFCGAR